MRIIRVLPKAIALLIACLIAAAAMAQGPCIPPTHVTPQTFTITYTGTVSGCSQNGGVCLKNEPITFTAQGDFPPCPTVYAWNFTDGSPIGGTFSGTPITHQFTMAGNYQVQINVTIGSSHFTITQPVLVADSVPTLSARMVVLLLLCLGGIGVLSLKT